MKLIRLNQQNKYDLLAEFLPKDAITAGVITLTKKVSAIDLAYFENCMNVLAKEFGKTLNIQNVFGNQIGFFEISPIQKVRVFWF